LKINYIWWFANKKGLIPLAQNILVGNPGEKMPVGGSGNDWRILFKQMFAIYGFCFIFTDESFDTPVTQNGMVKKTNKQTPWPLVRERTIPTERPPLVHEI
jgi:hypothetical protein